MRYLSVIASLFMTSALANVFNTWNLNHLQPNLDKSQFDLSFIKINWIEQPLDHFNTSEQRTITMKYCEYYDMWRENGPIYIFIEGQSAADIGYAIPTKDHLMGQMAIETNGALFVVEHRYYGLSYPDLPKDDIFEYYKFLSSQQALADIAYFIKMLKRNDKHKSSKVVVVGGSYAGNLAAWMRELYPELVDAAVAASAPVYAKKNFHEYLDVVRYVFGKYGTENCLQTIEKQFWLYDHHLRTASGIEYLKARFNICPTSDLTLLENQQYLMLQLFIPLMLYAESKTPNDIKQFCNDDNLADFYRLSHSSTFPCKDIDFYAEKFHDPWTYQFCNEFGYLRTTSSRKKPFGHWNPLYFLLKLCKHVIKGDLEKSVDEGIARTNRMYGGRSPNVSKVVFTHGDMDPWHPLGVLSDLGPEAPATIVNGTSHCAVLVVRPDEPKELVQNREYVKKLIKKWISTP